MSASDDEKRLTEALARATGAVRDAGKHLAAADDAAAELRVFMDGPGDPPAPRIRGEADKLDTAIADLQTELATLAEAHADAGAAAEGIVEARNAAESERDELNASSVDRDEAASTLADVAREMARWGLDAGAHWLDLRGLAPEHLELVRLAVADRPAPRPAPRPALLVAAPPVAAPLVAAPLVATPLVKRRRGPKPLDAAGALRELMACVPYPDKAARAVAPWSAFVRLHCDAAGALYMERAHPGSDKAGWGPRWGATVVPDGAYPRPSIGGPWSAWVDARDLTGALRAVKVNKDATRTRLVYDTDTGPAPRVYAGDTWLDTHAPLPGPPATPNVTGPTVLVPRAAVDAVAYAASTEPYRYATTGLLLDGSTGALWATDGVRLAVTPLPPVTPSPLLRDTYGIVPPGAFPGATSCEVTIGPEYARLVAGSLTIVTALVSGHYPPVCNIVPPVERTKYRLEVRDRDELAAEVARFVKWAGRDPLKAPAMRVEYDRSGDVVLRAARQATGETFASARILAALYGVGEFPELPPELAFDGRMMLDMLKALGGAGPLTLEWERFNGPCVVRDVATHLLMPARIE